jgi:predicted TIM-barrel fold metal-dependent hydrolase
MSVLEKVFGRILDTDSHEWIPTLHWDREFGPSTALLAAVVDGMPESGHQGFYTLKIDDEAEIDPDTIWQVKGSPAPGAIDMSRRPAVLDAMGIDRQLIFPSGPGVFGPVLATSPTERVMRKLLRDLGPIAAIWSEAADQFDARAIGHELCRAHNDWCIRVAAIDDRLRPVGVLAPISIDDAMAEAQRLIDAGVRAVMMPSDCPPGGKSPAHPDLDSFWRMFAEANVPVLLHIAGELNFMTSMVWGEAPIFEPNITTVSEIALDPYTLSTAHFGAQNFLTTMILGGVFERHPALRFGIIELTSHWVGPMCENLTMWAEQFSKRLSSVLSLSPSEYLRRNVRVSSFCWEPVDKYIERYELEDVYTFSSDYPHIEGGTETAFQFADRLKALGPNVVEKFFVTNGQLLLP